MQDGLALSLKDFLTILIQLGTFAVAIVAVTTWQRQLKGTTTHSAAIKVASAAKTLSNLFFESRAPIFEAWEFPAAYHEMSKTERSDAAEAEAWKHAYNTRFQQLWPQVLKLAEMRGEIGAVLSDPVADAAERLARKAKELKYWMEHDLDLKRAGDDFVARVHDARYVARVRASVVAHDEQDDQLSREFIAAREKLLALVRPYLL